MIGTNELLQEVLRKIRKFSASEAPVLVTGESGTGKELAAETVHKRSSRSKGPFVAVNCGALPADLIQSELFGHEKGAFTGAYQRKIGRIEAAQNGTIFLDEIGDLAPDLQVNLLRFLQEQVVERVGSIAPIPVNARVVAATHVDLERAVAEGRFREDLYYRLAVLHLYIPPLRERGEDVELLANYFLNRFRDDKNSRIEGFSKAALTAIHYHPWPGNVRELMNRIRRALVMCEGHHITPEDLGLVPLTKPKDLLTLKEARAQAERAAIEAALRHCGKNVSRAASILAISRVTLYQCMSKYGMGAS